MLFLRGLCRCGFVASNRFHVHLLSVRKVTHDFSGFAARFYRHPDPIAFYGLLPDPGLDDGLLDYQAGLDIIDPPLRLSCSNAAVRVKPVPEWRPVSNGPICRGKNTFLAEQRV